MTRPAASFKPQQSGIPERGNTGPDTDSRIEGLDSIRFICALWVFFSHCGGGPLAEIRRRGKGATPR